MTRGMVGGKTLHSMRAAFLRTSRKFGWAACSQFGRHLVQFVSLIVLARLLSPQDFGVMSLAVVVTGFINMFRDMGTGAALIQRDVAHTPLVGSVFSLNALLGIAGGLVTAALAPLAAAFFATPMLEPVLQTLAVSLTLAGLGVVPQAVMERTGRFRQLAQIELSGALTGLVTAIAMAYNGWGVWSLVGQTLVTTVLITGLLVVASGARPALRPDWALLRSIARYSLNLTGFNVSNYLMRNADNAIIGKLLGSRELGYYALAYHLALGPVRSIGWVLGRVLFPSLARMQHDLPALRRECLDAIRLITLVCCPLMALLVALADLGTLVLFGESWTPMVPILMALGVVGFLQAPMIVTGFAFMAVGRADILLRWGLITNALAVLAFLIGAQWSPFGVAVGYLVYTCAIGYPYFRLTFRVVGLSLDDVWRVSARPAIASVVAGLIAWWVAGSMEGSAGATGALIGGTAAGSLSYLACCITAWSGFAGFPRSGESRSKP